MIVIAPPNPLRRVWFDGIEVEDVCEMDASDSPGENFDGYIVQFVRDTNGDFKYDSSDDILRIERKGMVKWMPL